MFTEQADGILIEDAKRKKEALFSVGCFSPSGCHQGLWADKRAI
jgi:hypothetical protein